MSPQQRFTLLDGSVDDVRQELAEKTGMLRLGSNIGEIYIASIGKADEAHPPAVLLRHNDILPLQTLGPLGSGTRSRDPSRSLLLRVETVAVPHGVEHDVGKQIGIGGSCPAELTGRKHSGCSVCRSWCEIGGLGRCLQWVESEHAWYVSDRAREVADAGELMLVALVVGALLASLVGLLAHLVGYDCDRSFYAVVLTVISALYPLFAVMDGARNLVPEVVFFALFAAMGASGFRTSLWVVAVGLLLHGLFDFVRHAHLPAHGAPAWWPAFCGAYDVVAAAGLAFLLVAKRGPATSARHQHSV